MLAVCHTFYSLQAGVISPKRWAKGAVERGYSAVLLADVNGLYGAVEFQQAMTGAGLTPLIGAMVCMGPDAWAVAAVRDEGGYAELCRLLSALHLEAGFCLFDYLRRHPPKGLFFLSRSVRTLGELMEVLPVDRLLRLPGARSRELNLWDASAAVDRLPVLPVPDAWFLEETDRECFGWLCELRRRSGGTVLPPMEQPGAVLPAVADWRRCTGVDDDRVRSFTEACEFRMPVGRPPMVPKLDARDVAESAVVTQSGQAVRSGCPRGANRGTPNALRPGGQSDGVSRELRRICGGELAARYGTGERHRQAAVRLDHELEVIIGNGFADYFLYVYEIIRFARSRRIPVEVRGSAASSLVSHLLGFTHCCPLEHDLLFERFMNPGRTDCPDIDIDIADNRRDEVVEYCYRRWGSDHVAMIATVSTYRARGAAHDAGRLLGIPQADVQAYLDQGRPLGKARGNAEVESEFLRISARLVGLPRHLGVHCGGLVITPCPITDVTPLFRSSKGIVTTHFEKDQAEAIGLVKMDLLGNSALSVIDEGVRLVEERGLAFHEPGPRYDYKVNRLFETGETLGVYQCESPGMRQLCRALAPTSQRQAAIALSLIRPGPAAAGMKDVYIRRKRGLEPVCWLHPRMKDFLEDTYGVMLYQEDVMKVAVHVAGYSFADADSLRRIMSKSRGTRPFLDEKHRFVFQKAEEAGVSHATAEKVWEHVSRFAAYSYCKAHATVYGRLAWLTARLKAHHPREFFTAALNWHNSMYPKRVMVWDAIRHGIPVLPVDIRHSMLRWTSTRYGIRAGFSLVKGLHARTVSRLLEERAREPFRSIHDVCRRVQPAENDLYSLIVLGACRGFGSREQVLHEASQLAGNRVQGNLFATSQGRLLDPLRAELDLTGIPFSVHPLQWLPPGVCPARDMGRHINQQVQMVGILDSVKELQVRKHEETPGDPMSFITLEDATGLFEAVLFPRAHARFRPAIRTAGPYRITGTVTESWGSLNLEVNDLRHIA